MAVELKLETNRPMSNYSHVTPLKPLYFMALLVVAQGQP